eukprot:4369082-Alexandrium_andersonii.AAC.1
MSPVGAPASQLQRGVRLGGACRSYPFRRSVLLQIQSPIAVSLRRCPASMCSSLALAAHAQLR